MIDVRTNPGLREALLKLPDPRHWNTPLGRQVIEAVSCRARVVATRCGRSADTPPTDLSESLIGYAWEVLVTQREQIIGAESPWGLLYRAMTRHANAEVRAADLLTSSARVRSAVGAAAHTATRLGDALPPDHASEARPWTMRADNDGWDDGLSALHDELVKAGADSAAAREALASALDILNTTTRRSHLHTGAYRNQRLLDMLGRTGTCALMNLLIGSRREGPAGSAWLALREAARAGQPAELDTAHPHSVSRVHTVAEHLSGSDPQHALAGMPG